MLSLGFDMVFLDLDFFLVLTRGHFFHCLFEREEERERHIGVRESWIVTSPTCADQGSYTSRPGSNLQLRHVPLLEVEAPTLPLWEDAPTN